jgi:hypothetical protein
VLATEHSGGGRNTNVMLRLLAGAVGVILFFAILVFANKRLSGR